MGTVLLCPFVGALGAVSVATLHFFWVLQMFYTTTSPRNRQQNWQDRKRQEGCCITCGRKRQKGNTSRCNRCLKKHREQNRERYRRMAAALRQLGSSRAPAIKYWTAVSFTVDKVPAKNAKVAKTKIRQAVIAALKKAKLQYSFLECSDADKE